MKKLAILAVATLLMVSCCECKRFQKKYGRSFTGTTWELVQLGGTAVNEAGKYQVTFSEDGKISGIGYCNRLIGSFTKGEKEGVIALAPLASTKMMCLNENVEDEFFKALDGITSYSMDGPKLYLFASGELRAVFEAQDDLPKP